MFIDKKPAGQGDLEYRGEIYNAPAHVDTNSVCKALAARAETNFSEVYALRNFAENYLKNLSSLNRSAIFQLLQALELHAGDRVPASSDCLDLPPKTLGRGESVEKKISKKHGLFSPPAPAPV